MEELVGACAQALGDALLASPEKTNVVDCALYTDAVLDAKLLTPLFLQIPLFESHYSKYQTKSWRDRLQVQPKHEPLHYMREIS